MKTTSCKSCGALIVWATSDTGKAMPVDVEPSEGGTIVLHGTDPNPIFRVLRKGEKYAGMLYRSHFSTCPNAARHRRQRNDGPSWMAGSDGEP